MPGPAGELRDLGEFLGNVRIHRVRNNDHGTLARRAHARYAKRQGRGRDTHSHTHVCIDTHALVHTRYIDKWITIKGTAVP